MKAKIMHITPLLTFVAAAGFLLYGACSGEQPPPGEQEIECTVTFDTAGGSPASIPSIKVVKGKNMGAQYPGDPQKQGYNFGGWFEGTTRYFRNTAIEKDIDLTASWNEAPPDKEKFHVYLCFGQSNMEGYVSGGGIPEDDKTGVDERFKVLAAVTDGGRVMGQWYTAVPPLCRSDTGLTPADYFGRTLLEGIDDPDVKVGVIVVAVAGCAINLFEKDTAVSAPYLNAQPDWMKNIAAQYENTPYQRLIDMAKIAQETGVIKGILLHQGESGKAGSNNQNGSDNTNWGAAVKRIYDNILEDLELEPDSIPLLAGQVVGNNSGIITNLPNTMQGIAHVIPSNGCAAAGPSGNDALHFNYEGYRELGRRYAAKMLELLY